MTQLRQKMVLSPLSTATLVIGLSAIGSVAHAGELRPIANIFKPLSAPAEAVYETSLLALLICEGIFIVVGGLLAYASIKFRAKAGDDGKEPPQIYGSNQLELAWTVIPILIVFVLVLVTARTIADVQNAKLPDDALKVRVVGHPWWWEIHYPEHGVVTANELHIPVSSWEGPRPTDLASSVDLTAHRHINSRSSYFGVMEAKQDLFPTRRGQVHLQANELIATIQTYKALRRRLANLSAVKQVA